MIKESYYQNVIVRANHVNYSSWYGDHQKIVVNPKKDGASRYF